MQGEHGACIAYNKTPQKKANAGREFVEKCERKATDGGLLCSQHLGKLIEDPKWKLQFGYKRDEVLAHTNKFLKARETKEINWLVKYTLPPVLFFIILLAANSIERSYWLPYGIDIYNIKSNESDDITILFKYISNIFTPAIIINTLFFISIIILIKITLNLIKFLIKSTNKIIKILFFILYIAISPIFFIIIIEFILLDMIYILFTVYFMKIKYKNNSITTTQKLYKSYIKLDLNYFIESKTIDKLIENLSVKKLSRNILNIHSYKEINIIISFIFIFIVLTITSITTYSNSNDFLAKINKLNNLNSKNSDVNKYSFSRFLNSIHSYFSLFQNRKPDLVYVILNTKYNIGTKFSFIKSTQNKICKNRRDYNECTHQKHWKLTKLYHLGNLGSNAYFHTLGPKSGTLMIPLKNIDYMSYDEEIWRSEEELIKTELPKNTDKPLINDKKQPALTVSTQTSIKLKDIPNSPELTNKVHQTISTIFRQPPSKPIDLQSLINKLHEVHLPFIRPQLHRSVELAASYRRGQRTWDIAPPTSKQVINRHNKGHRGVVYNQLVAINDQLEKLTQSTINNLSLTCDAPAPIKIASRTNTNIPKLSVQCQLLHLLGKIANKKPTIKVVNVQPPIRVDGPKINITMKPKITVGPVVRERQNNKIRTLPFLASQRIEARLTAMCQAPKNIDESAWITLAPELKFEHSKYSSAPNQQDWLNQLRTNIIKIMKNNTNTEILLAFEGGADSTGTPLTNLRFSELRADHALRMIKESLSQKPLKFKIMLTSFGTGEWDEISRIKQVTTTSHTANRNFAPRSVITRLCLNPVQATTIKSPKR